MKNTNRVLALLGVMLVAVLALQAYKLRQIDTLERTITGLETTFTSRFDRIAELILES